ncbi:Formamidopyrimidine-DNA glycosylase [Lignipirellula cremea]|uniref:Formamidopyrimidine-DNA glycosylase n=2 Tax=Lignipirellula cremea TaxID=2528010 RepID=A0A518DW20_9BACT|nr:Formamidopyrimidine-DNA glycosylase [Lignipirellula cremea]
MRRGLLPVVGAVIADVARPPCACRPITIEPELTAFRRRVVGRTIVAIDRIGKRVVVRLSSNDCIIFEPRMTGLVLIADPPGAEHLRLRVDLEGFEQPLLFWDRRGLGSVRLLSPAEYAVRLGPEKIGPDALTLTAEQLQQALGGSQREIKPALLDQKRLAGVGNLYASEVLHLAGVHPQKRCDRMTTAQWRRVHEQLLHVLEEAILYEGSTLGDGTYRNALNQSGGYQNHHRVYDREGDLCRRCGQATIERIVQTQRSTFFCPACQTKR